MAKILIVGTAPYDKNCQSRAFESYFHGIEHEYLAQIFTYPHKPPKGHCGKLYQITDAMMLKRFFSRRSVSGIEYTIDQLNETDGVNAKLGNDANQKGSRIIKKIYALGKKDRPITYLLRGLIWKKSSWCTPQLNEWLDDFKPDCVFLSFSDDFFIPRIALYVANRYDIPIISSIADDYYFNDKKSINPLYHIYRKEYKKLINSILRRKDSTAVYIGNRIKEKYNTYFGMSGITLYLTSDIVRRPFRPIDTDNLIVSYYGNVRLGRNKSLIEIGAALYDINKCFHLNVYTNEKDEAIIEELKRSKGVVFNGSVPYAAVQKGMLESDILVIVEGFDPRNITTVKYSISTKVPDSLSTGAQVFAYGDRDCGAIDYLISTNSISICDNQEELKETLRGLIYSSKDEQLNYYNEMIKTVETNHNIQKNVIKFKELVNGLVK